MKYKIVTIEFPYAEKATTKIRPVLCLTEPTARHQDCIVAAITSHITNPTSTDILLDSSTPYFPQTGLKKSSLIRLDKLVTVHASRMITELGELPERCIPAVHRNLRRVFEIT